MRGYWTYGGILHDHIGTLLVLIAQYFPLPPLRPPAHSPARPTSFPSTPSCPRRTCSGFAYYISLSGNSERFQHPGGGPYSAPRGHRYRPHHRRRRRPEAGVPLPLGGRRRQGRRYQRLRVGATPRNHATCSRVLMFFFRHCLRRPSMLFLPRLPLGVLFLCRIVCRSCALSAVFFSG